LTRAREQKYKAKKEPHAKHGNNKHLYKTKQSLTPSLIRLELLSHRKFAPKNTFLNQTLLKTQNKNLTNLIKNNHLLLFEYIQTRDQDTNLKRRSMMMEL